MSLWDTVKGPHPDIKGKHPFTLYSGFITGTLVFTHYTPAGQGYYSTLPVKGAKQILAMPLKG